MLDDYSIFRTKLLTKFGNRKKSLNMLIALAISIIFSGCYSRRELPFNHDTNRLDETKSIVIHTPTEEYSLTNYHFLDSSLVGNLTVKTPTKGYILHVYTNRVFDIGQEHSLYLELPNSQITKMDYKKFSIEKSLLAAPSYILGVYIIVRLFFSIAY